MKKVMIRILNWLGVSKGSQEITAKLSAKCKNLGDTLLKNPELFDGPLTKAFKNLQKAFGTAKNFEASLEQAKELSINSWAWKKLDLSKPQTTEKEISDSQIVHIDLSSSIPKLPPYEIEEERIRIENDLALLREAQANLSSASRIVDDHIQDYEHALIRCSSTHRPCLHPDSDDCMDCSVTALDFSTDGLNKAQEIVENKKFTVLNYEEYSQLEKDKLMSRRISRCMSNASYLADHGDMELWDDDYPGYEDRNYLRWSLKNPIFEKLDFCSELIELDKRIRDTIIEKFAAFGKVPLTDKAIGETVNISFRKQVAIPEDGEIIDLYPDNLGKITAVEIGGEFVPVEELELRIYDPLILEGTMIKVEFDRLQSRLKNATDKFFLGNQVGTPFADYVDYLEKNPMPHGRIEIYDNLTPSPARTSGELADHSVTGDDHAAPCVDLPGRSVFDDYSGGLF